MNPVEDARALVAERFPDAVAAFLSGGALLRELRDADPPLAECMVTAIGSGTQLSEAADEVLARTGGRFWTGLRVAG